MEEDGRCVWVAGPNKGDQFQRDWVGNELVVALTGDGHNPSGHLGYTTIAIRPANMSIHMLHQRPNFYVAVCEYRGIC